MGHRLNVELTDGDELLCSCCWHEAAYTDTALDITEAVIKTYDDLFGGSGADIYLAVKLCEAMGGGITGVERERLRKEFGKIFELAPARSVYDGIITVTDESIRETRRWESGRVRIDLTGRIFDFHVHDYTYQEDYTDYCDRVSSAIDWNDLPQIDAGWDIFTSVYFDHIDMVRKIITQCPNGFRLRNGDVIEWR